MARQPSSLTQGFPHLLFLQITLFPQSLTKRLEMIAGSARFYLFNNHLFYPSSTPFFFPLAALQVTDCFRRLQGHVELDRILFFSSFFSFFSLFLLRLLFFWLRVGVGGYPFIRFLVQNMLAAINVKTKTMGRSFCYENLNSGYRTNSFLIVLSPFLFDSVFFLSSLSSIVSFLGENIVRWESIFYFLAPSLLISHD